MFTVSYLVPYCNHWMNVSFDTLNQANQMIEWYQSCGGSAHLIVN